MNNTPSAGEIVRATILHGIEQEYGGGRECATPAAQPVAGGDSQSAASRFNVVLPLKDGRCLAFNTLSGTFAVWSAAEVETYRRAEQGQYKVGDADLTEFVAGGYLIPAAVDELAALEQRYKAVRFDSARMLVTIIPTTSCNFACDYCFQGLEKPHIKMSDEVQHAFLSFLAKQLPRLQHFNVVWFGGEPLMGLATIRSLSRRMLLMCRKARVKYDAFIVTNGYFLTPEVARELFSLRVTSCQVTFDGPAMLHDQRRVLLSGRGTYETIVDNLRQVIEQVPMQVSARINIDDRNAGQVRELLDDLAARGFGGRQNFGVYFAPIEAITEPCHACSQVQIGKTAYGQLEAELYRYAVERGLCGLPKPSLFVGNCQAVRPNGLLLGANGDLHKCWDTMHEPELKVGTIFEPEKLAENPIFQRWLGWTPFANPVCRGCKILPMCTGFCAYKFVHPEKTRGEAGSLPCPSWKFNFNERIFLRAEKMGFVRREDIADQDLATSAASVGANHNVTDFPSISGGRRPFPIPVAARAAPAIECNP